MTTGQRIKEARKKAELTQKGLAEKLGIAYQTLAQWENDLRNPKYDTLKRIAAALNIPIHELISDEPGILDLLLPSGLHGLRANELKVDEDTLCYMLDQMIDVEQINPELYQRLKTVLYFLAVSSGLEHILVYYGDIYDEDEIDLSSPKAKEIIEKMTSDAKLLIAVKEGEFHTQMNTAFQELNFSGKREAAKRVKELTEIPRYRAETVPQPSLAPQEGTDTTPAPEGGEGAQKPSKDKK